MASMFKSGSSRRKAELPGRLRIQLKSKKSKSSKHDDVDDDDTDNDEADKDEQLTVSFGNGIPDDLPEGTIVVQPEAVEDLPVKRKRDGTTVTLSETVEDVPAKKKRESLTRINIAVLDNVSCTACGHQLNPYKNGALQKHPELKVAICKHCDKFLSSGAISKDEDGTDEQCRWCGEGGRLLVCDDCSSAFCKACVMRNFSRSQFNTINDQDNWQCYLCNPTPLENLRENYRKIRDTLKAIKEKEKLKSAVSTASPAGKGMPSSGRLAVSKDNVTIPTTKNASSVTRSGKQPPVVSDQNVEEEMPASSVLLRLEDLNVKFSNVDTTIDKLCTATNTFREVLLAVKSQSKVLSAQLQLKRQQNLHKSLEAYLRSLKIILTESQNTDEDEQQLTHTKDIPAVKSSNKESSLCTSSSKTSSSSSRSSTNSSTIQKGSISRPHANTNSIDSKNQLMDNRALQLPKKLRMMCQNLKRK